MSSCLWLKQIQVSTPRGDFILISEVLLLLGKWCSRGICSSRIPILIEVMESRNFGKTRRIVWNANAWLYETFYLSTLCPTWSLLLLELKHRSKTPLKSLPSRLLPVGRLNPTRICRKSGFHTNSIFFLNSNHFIEFQYGKERLGVFFCLSFNCPSARVRCKVFFVNVHGPGFSIELSKCLDVATLLSQRVLWAL